MGHGVFVRKGCQAKNPVFQGSARYLISHHFTDNTHSAFGNLCLRRLTARRDNWMALLESAERDGWLDKMTRSVFVEFTVNNGNTNLFTQVKIMLETPVFGGE